MRNRRRYALNFVLCRWNPDIEGKPEYQTYNIDINR